MSGVGKGIERVEVRLKWDPSPLGQPPTDLDVVAGPYERSGLRPLPGSGGGSAGPAYVVHYDSRSPDGTIWLNHDSRTGQGFGWDEVMTLDLGRLSERYDRVVVGVTIQQRPVRRDFAGVLHPAFEVVEGYAVLAAGDFTEVAGSVAATVAEFRRRDSGAWEFHAALRGYDTDSDTFIRTLGDSAPA